MGLNSLKTVVGQRFIESKVQYDLSLSDEKYLISSSIPDFVPIVNSESAIIDEIGFKMLTLHLPPLIKMRDWTLLYSIDQDGTSMMTFYNCVKDFDEVVILIKDADDSVFGCFTTEKWHYDKKFYGNAESWVFNFDIQQH
jgi:hypothetical protein